MKIWDCRILIIIKPNETGINYLKFNHAHIYIRFYIFISQLTLVNTTVNSWTLTISNMVWIWPAYHNENKTKRIFHSGQILQDRLAPGVAKLSSIFTKKDYETTLKNVYLVKQLSYKRGYYPIKSISHNDHLGTQQFPKVII